MKAVDREPVNILLVDDQPAKLLAYEAMLEPLGEHLIRANSGREALDRLLRDEITVVLMDVSMPELDGFELAEIIRSHPRHQKTAIIFVSAVYLTDMDRLKAYASGAVDYISVPVVPEILRAKILVFTELYRKTREAERLNRDLETRVSERTAELQASMAKQLELATQLRETDRRKDEFLALLAHELRNPLAPIRNAIEIMGRSHAASEELLWCRDILRRQSAQLTRLVDDLLDVSRITQGKIKLRRERLDLAEILRETIEVSQPLIDARGHRLAVSFCDSAITVEGDSARLIQALSNLLNNAAKFQNDGGKIDVIVTCESGQAVIRVRDRGHGISPELLSRVFELFSQGERTPDQAQGGLGIGLSLARTLIDMHGGQISANSAGPGCGSEFVVHLPTAEPVARAAAIPVSRRQPTTASRRHVLVVDDNQDAADSLATLLRLGGHHVEVAHNGVDALEIATVQRPGFVLLDIGLPGMDGYEVCRRLRGLGLSESRIIAMTGYGQERDKRRSMEAGFDLHTVKPVEVDRLMTILAEG